MANSTIPAFTLKGVADCGVYLITNTVNGKVYVGSSRNIRSRMASHRGALRSGRHDSRLLQYAWNKYGEGAFVFKRILICSESDLAFYEQLAIDAYQSANRAHGYNYLPFAYSAAGVPQSEDAKLKKSLKLKGVPKPADTKRRMSESAKLRPAGYWQHQSAARTGEKNPMFGKKHSPEMIEHYRRASTGKTHTAESKEKIASAQRGEKNHRYGKRQSTEERIARSNAMAMFNAEQVAAIREMRASGATYKQIAAHFGCGTTCIRRVISGQRLAYRLK